MKFFFLCLLLRMMIYDFPRIHDAFSFPPGFASLLSFLDLSMNFPFFFLQKLVAVFWSARVWGFKKRFPLSTFPPFASLGVLVRNPPRWLLGAASFNRRCFSLCWQVHPGRPRHCLEDTLSLSEKYATNFLLTHRPIFATFFFCLGVLLSFKPSGRCAFVLWAWLVPSSFVLRFTSHCLHHDTLEFCLRFFPRSPYSYAPCHRPDHIAHLAKTTNSISDSTSDHQLHFPL